MNEKRHVESIAIIPCFSNICYYLPAYESPAGDDKPRLSLLERVRGFVGHSM